MYSKSKRLHMKRSTITSKGQLTLPKEVRQRLGLQSGDRVVFEFEGETVRVRAERRRSLSSLKGSLPGREEYPGREAERQSAREHAGGLHAAKYGEG
jgi:AbrB family looped-hinge helix DNA binding protein